MNTEPLGPVLITGGNGFLGRALTKRLLDAGESVVCLDIGTSTDSDPRAIHLCADIRDTKRLHQMAGEQGIRAIVHLAALVIPECRARPSMGAEVNIVGHLNMLELARERGIRRFVYTSSIAARPRAPYDSPVNLYGVWKHACEDAAKVWYLDHGLPSIGLRPNVIYGPGREVGETAAITLAIKAAAQGQAYTLPFTSRLCLQYVDEVTDIMERCLRSEPAGPIVSDLTTTVQDTEEVIAAIQACDSTAQITQAPTRRPSPTAFDNSALQALIGQWPSIDLQAGVRRTFDHYRAIQ